MRTVAEGVLWRPEDALVRAGVDGFAVELLAQPGQAVGRGDPLLRLRSSELDAEARVMVAQLREEEILRPRRASRWCRRSRGSGR
jgi:putative peptide zinc metalloprotease protein